MSCPTLFGRPALEPLILFEPALDVRQDDIVHGCLGRDLLALIASLFGCRLLLKELGNRITGEAKVAGRCPLALALDQDPGANFISKCHGIHLPSSARLIFLSSIADSWGQWLTFPGSVWPSIMIAFTRKKDDQPRCRHAIQRRGERNGSPGKHGLHTPQGCRRNEERRWRIQWRDRGKLQCDLIGGCDPGLSVNILLSCR